MNHNYCIIMSGGIGSRFWPISRSDKPKQFLDFFGTGQSLLQATFRRFNEVIPAENIYVVTNEQYYDLTKQQLPSLKDHQILLEPQRRNTAPCIAWASYHIRQVDPQANIVVSPSDHLILDEKTFQDVVVRSLDFVANNNKLLTLGMKPTRPETGYGYIQTDTVGLGDFKQVKTFREKPDVELAKSFLASGDFLWNAGIFFWNVNTIASAFEAHLPAIATLFEQNRTILNTPEEKAFIQSHFGSCQNISIDFGIMEKADNVHVLEADFGWSDLGTWGSLHDLSDKDENQNVCLRAHTLSYESNNNIISVEGDQLVVIQGLEDYIIAQDNNVLLICKKEDEQRIRGFVEDAKEAFGEKYI